MIHPVLFTIGGRYHIFRRLAAGVLCALALVALLLFGGQAAASDEMRARALDAGEITIVHNIG